VGAMPFDAAGPMEGAGAIVDGEVEAIPIWD
jgi:hypothetical protein